MSYLASHAAEGGRARPGRSRPAVAVLGGALMAALVPLAPASAAPPLQGSSERVVASGCTAPAQEGISASLDVSWSDGNAFDTVLALSEDGAVIAHEDPELTQAEWDGSALSGELTLLDARPGSGGGPIGTATFVLDLAPTGEATTETSRWRDGNATVRETVVRRLMEVSDGTLTVRWGNRDLDFRLTGCTGQATTTLTVRSQPDTVVRRDPPDILAECSAEITGNQLFADLSSLDGPHVMVAVVNGDGVAFGLAPVNFSRPPQPVQVTVELVREVDGELVPAGTAAVDMSSAKVGQTRTTLVYQGGRDRFSTTFYRLDGTVTVDGLPPFRIAGCEGYVTTALVRTSSPSGPATGGPVPSNDAPETAAQLTLGGPGVNVQTRGAAEGLEVPMSCEIPSEDGRLTPGHSVWFRFAGTGGPVTLDPSGSSFNTVLAVYREQDDALFEYSCLDDVLGGTSPTTQPPLTVGTVVGATYYVQAAGYAQQYGRLRLAATAH